MSDILSTYADTEKFLSRNADQARVQAARLAEAQEGLIQIVSSVRDVANLAAVVAVRIQIGSFAAESDLQPATQGVALLARILNQINELSNIIAAAIESQGAAARALIEIVGETAKASACLAEKAATLAEEIGTLLPALSSKPLVQAQLKWLSGELQKTLAGLRRGSEGVAEEPVDELTIQLPDTPQLVN
jgi:methyl-accepting chemotaxis protein